MKLTPEEERMLAGDRGHAVGKSMQILVALGRIFDAEGMLPVRKVQISGVSYDNLGDAGLEYLRELSADGRVRVPTTLNPAGMDTQAWAEMGIPESFALKQQEVVAVFERMGVNTTLSCTPYLIGSVPEHGEHIAWGESSAVTFANSVLGARTNKEGGPSSIAAALTGRTPAYGLHLDENRRPHVLVQVDAKVESRADYGALGMVLGERLNGDIALLAGVEGRSWSHLKALCAALPTFGGAPIFHIEGITPERWQRPNRSIRIEQAEIDAAHASLDDGVEQPDLVFLGCPHLSLEELEQIADLLEGRIVRGELWLGVAREIKERADALGISARIKAAGARIASDTCHVVAPLRGRFDSFATNSAKGIYYGRAKNRFRSRFASMRECVEMATEER